MKRFTSKTQKTGEIGEDIACRFLVKRGFKIVERNYTKRWGEIDIVAKKAKRLHFLEVKTVSCDLGSLGGHTYSPEEKVDRRKLIRISKALKSYLAERRVSRETDWQIDVLTVLLDLKNKQAKVEMIDNVVI